MAVIFPSRARSRPGTLVLEKLIGGLANAPGAHFIEDFLPACPTPRETVGDQLRIHTSGTIMAVDPTAFFGIAELNDEWANRAAPNKVPGAQLAAAVAYSTKRRALAVEWSREDDSDSQSAVAPSALSIRQAVEALRLKRAQRLASIITGSTWSTTATLGAGLEWSDAAGAPNVAADPVSNLLDLKDGLESWGVEGNALVLGRPSYLGLQRHPAVLDRLPTTIDRNALTQNALKQFLSNLLEIDPAMIFFGKARYNSASTGATQSNANVFGDFAFMCRIDPKPMVEPVDPSAPGASGDMRASSSAILRLESYGMTSQAWTDEEKDNEGLTVKFREDIIQFQAQAGAYLANTQA